MDWVLESVGAKQLTTAPAKRDGINQGHLLIPLILFRSES
jgi:hypothetical protein